MLDDFSKLADLEIFDIVFDRTREVMQTHLPIWFLHELPDKTYSSLSRRNVAFASTHLCACFDAAHFDSNLSMTTVTRFICRVVS